jgi:hypothetical protein
MSAITSIVTGPILASIASAGARSPVGNAAVAGGGLGSMDWSLVAILAGMSCYLVLGALMPFFTIARLRRQGRLSNASRHTRDQLIVRMLLILTVAASFFGSASSVEAGPARNLPSLRSELERSTIYPADNLGGFTTALAVRLGGDEGSRDDHEHQRSYLSIFLFALLGIALLAVGIGLVSYSVFQSYNSTAYPIALLIASWFVIASAMWIILVGVFGWHLYPDSYALIDRYGALRLDVNDAASRGYRTPIQNLGLKLEPRRRERAVLHADTNLYVAGGRQAGILDLHQNGGPLTDNELHGDAFRHQVGSHLAPGGLIRAFYEVNSGAPQQPGGPEQKTGEQRNDAIMVRVHERCETPSEKARRIQENGDTFIEGLAGILLVLLVNAALKRF